MRRPWIGGKDFHDFHWTNKTSLKKGHEKLGEEEFLGGLLLVLFFLGRGGEG
jgi:hypothetical protein